MGVYLRLLTPSDDPPDEPLLYSACPNPARVKIRRQTLPLWKRWRCLGPRIISGVGHLFIFCRKCPNDDWMGYDIKDGGTKE